MSAPSSCRQLRRTVRVLGKEYKDVRYKPQFALGVLCEDENDQRACFTQIRKALPGREVKVLVV